MDLIPVIKELLYSHDCVIIPGFGGFIGNYAPAYCDRTTNTFHPPAKHISFNRNLTHNDGLLTGTVSAKTALGYSDARNLVGEFADEVKKRLEKGEKVIFDQIGSFTTNSEGNYLFEPYRELNFNLQAYGLTSFTFAPLAGINQVRKINNPEAGIKNSTHRFRRYLWRAAVILPLAGALVAIPFTTDLFRTKTQTTSLYPVPVNTETTDLKPGTLNDGKADLTVVNVDSPGAGSDSVVTGTPALVETPSAAAESYHVIAGSFRLRENAEVLAGTLAREGYEPQVIDGPNGFLRVSALRCGTLDEAMKIKNRLAAKYPGTWVKKAL